MRSVLHLTGLNLVRLYRRLFLLLAAAAAFAMLSFPLAEGMSRFFDREDMPGISIAVVGDTDGALSSFAGNLRDIAAYCSFIPAEMDEAMDKLQRGEVTAVLELPEDFVGSILRGENSPARVHVDENRPVESLLTIYAGQCAADMLSAAQGGIYTVLDALKEAGEYDEADVLDINMEYIKFTLSRGDMYEPEMVSAAGAVPVGEHYRSSLMMWLLLTSGVIYYPIVSRKHSPWKNRLRAAGITGTEWAFGAIAPVLLVQTGLAFALCAFAGNFDPACAMALAAFSAGTAAFVGTISTNEPFCGGGVLILAAAISFFSGGIVPPVLLPAYIRNSLLFVWADAFAGCMHGRLSLLPLFCGSALLTAAFLLLRSGFGREENI